MATRRSDALANREALIEAGIRVFSDDPDAGLARVAEEAGVSRRTLYGHFRSRAELIEALAAHVAERLVALVAQVPDDPDPIVTLARTVRVIGRDLVTYRRLGRLALSEGADRSVHAHARAGSDRLRALVARAHQEALIDTALPVSVHYSLSNAAVQAVFEALIAGDLSQAEAPEVAVRAVLNTLGVPAPVREEVLSR